MSRDAQERDPLVVELERRLGALESLDEARFGEFTRLDWILCVILFLVLPHLFLWWFS